MPWTFRLVGAPAQPAATIGFQLRAVLTLTATPEVMRIAGQLVALIIDPDDASKASRADEVSMFGVCVSLAAAAEGASVGAESADCPEYIDVRKEYGAMALRMTPFNSRSSAPSEWGYTEDFVSSVLGSKVHGDRDTKAIADLLMVACGGGCPLAQLPPDFTIEGACVLDLGCGGGHDLALAARAVGPTGKVIGMDLTPQMLERAETVVSTVSDATTSCPVDFLCAPADQCGETSRPARYADVADLVISNGVFNLCPDKQGAFDTAYHWCKPGGLIVFADVVLEDHCETSTLTTGDQLVAPVTVGDSFTSSGWSN